MSYTSATWSSWVDGSVGAATSSSCYSTTGTWTTWVTATYDSTTATISSGNLTCTDTVWYEWCSDGSLKPLSNGGVYHDYGYRQKVESAEEKATRLERERADAEQRRIEAEKRTREAEERERKAYAFLLLCLNEKQKKDLKEKKHFELSVVGGRKYRINTGQCRNIQELGEDGKVKRTLCFHPQDNLHHYDAMAIQKLTLECDEEIALKVANFS